MMDELRMLSGRDMADITGWSYAKCLEVIKAHGKKVGQRWFISLKKMRQVLAEEEEEC